MARTKKAVAAPVEEVAPKEEVVEIINEQPTEKGDKDVLSFPTGKKPQRKHSLICNPKSKQFNAKVAARRAKEKARRKAAKKNRK